MADEGAVGPQLGREGPGVRLDGVEDIGVDRQAQVRIHGLHDVGSGVPVHHERPAAANPIDR